MQDFFDEIEQDIKEEKIKNIIKIFIIFFLILFCVSIIATAIYVWFDNKQTKEAKYMNELYYDFINSADDKKKSIELLDKIIAHQHAGYTPIALMQKASITLEDNNTKEAIKLYNQLYMGNYNQSFKELAGLNSAILSIINGQDEDVDSKLIPISKNHSIFLASVLETRAIWYQKIANYSKAKEILLAIIDNNNLPKSLIHRAKANLSTVEEKSIIKLENITEE